MGYEKGSGTAWTVHLLGLEHGSNPFTQAKVQMSRPLILTILHLISHVSLCIIHSRAILNFS